MSVPDPHANDPHPQRPDTPDPGPEQSQIGQPQTEETQTGQPQTEETQTKQAPAAAAGWKLPVWAWPTVLGVLAVLVGYNTLQNARRTARENAVVTLPALSDHPHVSGTRGAVPVKAALFLDPGCLNCLRAVSELTPVLQDLMTRGAVTLTFVWVPQSGAQSVMAAKAADCLWNVRKEAVLDITRQVLSAQDAPEVAWAGPDLLNTLAKRQHLPAQVLGDCVNSPAETRRVAADLALYAGLQVSRMPALYVNGRPLSTDPEAFRTAVQYLWTQPVGSDGT